MLTNNRRCPTLLLLLAAIATMQCCLHGQIQSASAFKIASRTSMPVSAVGEFDLQSSKATWQRIARGGATDDDDTENDESDSEEEEEEDGSQTAVEMVTELGIKSVSLVATQLQIYSIKTFKALKRAFSAALQSDDDEDAEDGDDGEDTNQSVVVRMIESCWKVTKRMVKAMFTPDDDDEAGASGITNSEGGSDVSKAKQKTTKKTKTKAAKKKATKKPALNDDEDNDDKFEDLPQEEQSRQPSAQPMQDFGSYLSKAYAVPDKRDGMSVLSGNFQDALEKAGKEARMLLVFIPSRKPASKPNDDTAALRSILSKKVSKMSNKKARKTGETGSYYVWSAKAGSSEAVTAMKRMKVKPTSDKGGKKPILAVVYPAQNKKQRLDPNAKIFPRVLAQHHCSPPPDVDTMAGWLNALRKRSAKQYHILQKSRQELIFLGERKEGYKESIVNDNERQQREEEAEAERKAQAEREKQRLLEIATRREELKQNLPDPYEGDDGKTVALRFADGRMDKRRFAPDTQVEVLFNWVDGMHEMERETVVLTTMNGKLTFGWEEKTKSDGDGGVDEEEEASPLSKTLKEAGFAKNTGLRVTVKKEEEEEEKEGGADDDDEADEDD